MNLKIIMLSESSHPKSKKINNNKNGVRFHLYKTQENAN